MIPADYTISLKMDSFLNEMDSFLNEMEMWVTTPRDFDDAGFYWRIKRSNDIHSKLAEVKKWQDEVCASQARLENNWTSFNFDDYGISKWNLNFVKKELDVLVKDTCERINVWQSPSY